MASVLYDEYRSGERKAEYIPIHEMNVMSSLEYYEKEYIDSQPILAFARDLTNPGAVTDVHQGTQEGTLVPNPDYDPDAFDLGESLRQDKYSRPAFWDNVFTEPLPNTGKLPSTDKQIQFAGLTIAIIMLFMVID